MTVSERRVDGTPAPGLRWGWRLAIFAFLFLVLLVGLTELAVLVGAPLTPGLTWWSVTPLLAAAVVSSWGVMRVFEASPLSSLGLPVAPAGARQFVSGTALGIALIGGVVLVLAAFGWLRWTSDGGGSPYATWGWLAGVLAAAALTEELLFRGYPFRVLAARFGGLPAIGVTSIAFGAMHGANPNVGVLPLLNIGLAGVLLGLAYWRTMSLWYATGVHFGWNLSMALADLSVSGIGLGIPGYDPRLTGPDIWTGGRFGPEGGLLVTLAAGAGTLWLWRTRRLTRIHGASGSRMTPGHHQA